MLGCTTNEDVASGPFVGGTNGLEIGFVSEEPPERVFDDNEEPFDVSVELENVGEFDIPSNGIIVTLSGIDPNAFGISPTTEKLKNSLNGKSEFNNEIFSGDIDEVNFRDAKYKHDLAADFETFIRADICYDYQTTAVTEVCVKKDVTDRDDDGICDVNKDNVEASNSGAPVQVTTVSTRSAGSNEIQLNFVIENQASGSVHPSGTFTNICENNDDEEDRLDVEVRTATTGRYTVKCSQLGEKSSGEIKLVNNEKPIRCRITTSGAPDTPIEEQVVIELNYEYRNAIQTSLIVEDAERA